MADDNGLFSELDPVEQKYNRERAELVRDRAWNLVLAANRFTQNWVFVINAGGAAAALGYLGGHDGSGFSLYAALVTLTIFMIGLLFSMISAMRHEALLFVFHGKIFDWVNDYTEDKIPRSTAMPGFDDNAHNKVHNLAQIAILCAFFGCVIGLILLWIGMLLTTEQPATHSIPAGWF